VDSTRREHELERLVSDCAGFGLSVAPKLWYEHLFAFFLKDWFKHSNDDKCLLIKKDMLVILYVDNGGIAKASKQDVDDLIKRLTSTKFNVTREGHFSEFLEIKFVKDPVASTITPSEKGLINKITEATSMIDCNPNWTPANQLCLGSDPDGAPSADHWQP
jgi:hypothetical protein